MAHVRQAATGSDAVVGGVGWEARPFEDAPFYGVAVAWRPAQRQRGTRFDFTHYKMYARADSAVRVSGRWNTPRAS